MRRRAFLRNTWPAIKGLPRNVLTSFHRKRWPPCHHRWPTVGGLQQVSTSGTDSDFVVKLIDVYPADYQPIQLNQPDARQQQTDVPLPVETMNEYQQLVRGEPFRGKFRKSFEHPEPFVPNQVTPVNFEMPDVNHTFRRGHRIMVHVQSSWFPLVDLNPQTFVNIPDASPSDFKKAQQRIYRSQSTPSGIVVSVLPEK